MLEKKTEDTIRNIEQTSGTPFYLYDLDSLRRRIQLLQTRLNSETELIYSAKANSHRKILEVAMQEGLSVDIASVGELERALEAGFEKERIFFTGPAKRPNELKRGLEVEIGAFVVESVDELQEIDDLARRTGKRASIVVRLLPQQRLNHVGRLIVGEPSQFGIDEAGLDAFLAALGRTKQVQLIGTHSHVQSQILNAEYVIRNFEFALETSLLFQSKLVASGNAHLARESMRVVLGGGLGIPYSLGAAAFDLDHFAIQLRGLCVKYRDSSPLPGKMKFAIELGRYLVGEAGYFVAKILRCKNVHTQGGIIRYGIADGGFAHCQIATGAGQVVKSNLPFTILNRSTTADAGQKQVGAIRATVAGSTCYSQDILLREIQVDGLESGDLVVIKNVGGYGKQFSPTEFLLQPAAAEHFVDVK